MSNINANNINSVNATITNLNIQTINGIPFSNFTKCCPCVNSCSNNDNSCPQCQSYENCSCEQDYDDSCPECIPYNNCSCSCHAEVQNIQSTTVVQSVIPENINLFSYLLYLNGLETVTINPTFNKLTFTPPNVDDSIITNYFTANTAKSLLVSRLLDNVDSHGIQFATDKGFIKNTFIPNTIWHFSIWLDTNIPSNENMQVYWELYYNDNDSIYNPQLIAISEMVNIINNGGNPKNYVIQNN